MSQIVHAPQPQASDLRQVAATSGARLFAAYWAALAAVDLTRAAPGPLRLGVVVVVVAACSLRQPVATAGAIGGVGWLFVDGFVTHAHGVLVVDGPLDLVLLVLLVAVTVAAAIASGRAHRIVRSRTTREGAR